MLVLTREVHESIIINDNIKIVVISIDRGHVRLGIAAPREISVHRKEVYDKIEEEKNEECK